MPSANASHYFFAEVPERAVESNPEQNIAANEFHTEFDRILDRLPLRQRLAFVWSEIEQLSYQEIAEIEGVSLGTIKSRISRARQSIQEAFKHPKGGVQ